MRCDAIRGERKKQMRCRFVNHPCFFFQSLMNATTTLSLSPLLSLSLSFLSKHSSVLKEQRTTERMSLLRAMMRALSSVNKRERRMRCVRLKWKRREQQKAKNVCFCEENFGERKERKAERKEREREVLLFFTLSFCCFVVLFDSFTHHFYDGTTQY